MTTSQACIRREGYVSDLAPGMLPLGYGKNAERSSLWMKYDTIFRILQDAFGEVIA